VDKEEIEWLLKLYPKPLEWYYLIDKDIFVVSPNGLPYNTQWGLFQFTVLHPVSRYNQQDKCICGNSLKNPQLHHAILSRKDVMGCKGFASIGIHNSLNTYLVCDKCIPHPTREKSIKYLFEIYGADRIIWWYNQYPMRTKTFKIEYYLE